MKICIQIIMVLFCFDAALAEAQVKRMTPNKNATCGPIVETNKKKLMEIQSKTGELNVLGTPLQIAGTSPLTGYYRNGFCSTGADDAGVHVVAAVVTENFLQYSKSQGNDLVTPRGSFPGLKAGDTWCLCANRWKEALQANVAPPVILEATHAKALDFVTIEQLKAAIK